VISVSTHVLDTAAGRPAQGIEVRFERAHNGQWEEVSSGVTDDDGRVGALAAGLDAGHYRLRFTTGDHGNGFYPEVSIICDLDGSQDHYHIPLLIAPYGYTTYRGS
jgi:5-hydroxyisourate hydrolase